MASATTKTMGSPTNDAAKEEAFDELAQLLAEVERRTLALTALDDSDARPRTVAQRLRRLSRQIQEKLKDYFNELSQLDDSIDGRKEPPMNDADVRLLCDVDTNQAEVGSIVVLRSGLLSVRIDPTPSWLRTLSERAARFNKQIAEGSQFPGKDSLPHRFEPPYDNEDLAVLSRLLGEMSDFRAGLSVASEQR